MRKKLILMTNGTETLDFFSRQMEPEFQRLGYQTFLFDQAHEEESSEALSAFCGDSDSVLVTFNFDGLRLETSLFDGNGQLFWEKRHIPCVNIAVDHPFYFPEFIKLHPKDFYHVSIDRLHMDYIRRHYPAVKGNYFLPLAGTALAGNTPTKKRRYDIVFPGNFTPKETFDQYFDRLGTEYAAFYRSILDALLKDPSLADDAAIEDALRKEFPSATNEEQISAAGNMIFIDTYIRFYFRELVVKTLLEAGFSVHCIGAGWDKLSCKHLENLTYETNCYSLECLQRMADAKISLNVMPWFKDGAHDRVFNAMANGSVSLTDHSGYLDEILTDGQNAAFYDLKQLDALPEIVSALLKDEDRLESIAQNGCHLARKNHLWANRARTLHEMLLKDL